MLLSEALRVAGKVANPEMRLGAEFRLLNICVSATRKKIGIHILRIRIDESSVNVTI